MQRSSERILTTHVGSLPRPSALADMLVRQERGEAVDGRDCCAKRASAAVRDVVARQVAAGIDIINDGEQAARGLPDLRASAHAGLRRRIQAPARRATWPNFPEFWR